MTFRKYKMTDRIIIKKERTGTSIAGLLFFAVWIAGLVIAKGFWSTLFAIIPFYGWYLVVEKLLIHFQIIV